MKITRKQLRKLIKESAEITGKQFISNNSYAFKSAGWGLIIANSNLFQLEYDLPGYAQIVIYQRDPWSQLKLADATHVLKDDINTYVISSSVTGIWGKEVPIDLTDITLIKTITDLIRKAVNSFGDEIEYLKQGIELFASASEDPIMIKAAKLLDKALTPDN